MTPQLKAILINPTSSILDAIKAIDRGGVQIALVVDGDGRLLATVTDGDVRRGLLRGVSLEAPVGEIMHLDPATARSEDGRDAALRLMQQLSIHQVPVLDTQGRVVDLERIDNYLVPRRDNWIVLMAGGLGVRLRPLTETIPKPMLPVGGRPLLESIIRNIKDQGFQRFFIAVNHRREMVQDHFGDGDSFGVRIDYLIERESLGTAGALSLLPEPPPHTIIVMNADLLTSVGLDHLLQFHADQGAEATMCAREFTSQVPYGVIRFDGARLTEIEEKPTQRYFVNAGIYALSPSVFDLIAKNRRLDMPDLFSALLQRKRAAAVFPIREYWMDIGRMDDLQRARDEFEAVFGS